MLTFASIVPHPPILIPSIGKENLDKIEKTRNAMKELEKDLYTGKPDTIIVISSHASLFKDAFCVYSSPEFESNFEQFGDLVTKSKWQGDNVLASKLVEVARENGIKTQVISEKKLDHGVSVPLYYLASHLPDVKIIPIGYSEMDNKKHLEFGKIIKEVVMKSNERVAILASGDLSHGLTTEAPAGFSKVGQEFDQKIIELLETRNTTGIVNLEKDFVDEAAECGFRSLLVLLGILKNINYTFKNYSYEGPFGVGYLVGNFQLN